MGVYPAEIFLSGADKLSSGDIRRIHPCAYCTVCTVLQAEITRKPNPCRGALLTADPNYLASVSEGFPREMTDSWSEPIEGECRVGADVQDD